MRENRLDIEIERPIGEVFSFTVDPTKTHLWLDPIVAETSSDLPAKVGTVYRNLNLRGEWTEYEVVRLEKDKVFELVEKGGKYHVRYSYESLAPERTKLTYLEWVEGGELEEPFDSVNLTNLKNVMELRIY